MIVGYVIDHRRAAAQPWAGPTTLQRAHVTSTGDHAAAEIATRSGLDRCIYAEHGHLVRVRVYEYPDGQDLLAFDADAAPVLGTWVHDPGAGA